MKAFREQFSTGYVDAHDQMPNVSPAQSSIIVAILSAGTFFGALLAAPMGDKIGRRISLIIAVAIFSFGVLLQTIAMAITLLVLGRYDQLRWRFLSTKTDYISQILCWTWCWSRVRLSTSISI